ncbi:MAG: hypothetical protein IT184_17340 [Acidobacteria bacterium]|nr:hypothetical protein [Acidobacteriota bacterium]
MINNVHTSIAGTAQQPSSVRQVAKGINQHGASDPAQGFDRFLTDVLAKIGDANAGDRRVAPPASASPAVPDRVAPASTGAARVAGISR